MNRALLFLWFALLRRRFLRFFYNLRRPTSCIAVIAVATLLGVLFCFRKHEVVGKLVRRENLIGAALVMFCGAVFKGFLQKGLLCEPADVEFLFTSPFTQSQILFYRLLPTYLFAVNQSLAFSILFAAHLTHPLTTTICLAMFQVACFHVATAASLFAGTLAEETHLRVRWMMLACFFLITALYLRLAWNFKLLPARFSSPLVQLLFYPAVTVSDGVNASAIHRWAAQWNASDTSPLHGAWQSLLWLAGFSGIAAFSLWGLLRFRGNPYEAALNTTYRAAEHRQKVEQGRAARRTAARASMRLPRFSLFHGVGALVWKNCVAARRSRKEMTLAAFFALAYTGAFTAILWILHDLEKTGGGAPLSEARAFTTGIALFLGMLAFFLQRMFPFDFRQDGQHLLNFRTLPVSPFKLVLAEIAVPTILCLLAQAWGVVPLVLWGQFDWPTLVFVVLGFPAVALALNSVWNIHYLVTAARRMSGVTNSNTAVGAVVVVAFSFLVFYPAGWSTVKVANLFSDQNQSLGFTVAAAAGLTIQYGIDLLLILTMARLFQIFEFSREG